MIDYTEVQEQFNKVVSYSQDIFTVNSDELFEAWGTNKEKFYKSFGNKLIYEVPEEVEIKLSQKSKEKEFNSHVEKLLCYRYVALADFVKHNGVDGFYENRIQNDIEILVPGGENVKIQKGTKLLKCYKHFIKDKYTRDLLVNEASMIIQQDKVKGTLCFSIHPLDFLSLSENTHGWRSCHALDGEYRAGNLSYMADSSTIICYLKSEEEVTLPNFPSSVPWNNKKWRVLLFFSDDDRMLFAGRQYPFTSDSGIEKVSIYCPHKHLEWGIWRSKKLRHIDNEDPYGIDLYQPYIPIPGFLIPIGELIKDNCKEGPSLHYNDLLRSSCYDPIFSYNLIDRPWKNTRFTIGSDVKCLCCSSNYITDPEHMVCDCCGNYDEDYVYCDCCGDRIYYEDSWEWEGNYYCETCFLESHTRCEHCGEWFENESETMYEVDGLWLCTNCYGETMRERGEE